MLVPIEKYRVFLGVVGMLLKSLGFYARLLSLILFLCKSLKTQVVRAL
jgi:hypothetical protein